ncbi:hypothetical protein ASG99_14030 [Bacillus sp. Soil768D1]|nr:hypothetical protein ASG99_14030 [Bacillus sp. Soil768D1]
MRYKDIIILNNSYLPCYRASYLTIRKGVIVIRLLRLFVLCIPFYFTFTGTTYASNDSKELENSLSEIGYTSVHQALQDSNKHFNRTISLPIQLPPVPFTHNYGRFNNPEGKLNDGFEAEYFNKALSENHYMIRVRPVENRIKFKKGFIDQTFKLNDGNTAIYSTKASSVINLLIFEKDGWQYMLSVDKRISDKVTSKILIEIADSIK